MRKIFSMLSLTLLMLLTLPGFALAADTPKLDTGDTSWMIVATALVFLMTPGLALFYGGMSRRKNVLSVFMQVFIIIGLISVQWVLLGYSIAFGPDFGGTGLFGTLANAGLNGIKLDDLTGTIPTYVFVLFQLMFAVITPALIVGAYAERMRFPAFILFTVLWATFIYDPLAHWVWNADGWLFKLGALDFAGGTVVHISSGVAGLVAALVLGKRKGHGTEPMLPHHLPMTVLGAGLLWFGWFGFNAGSGLAANGLAANAFLVTNTAAAAAAIAWVLVEWFHHGKPTVLGAASGAVAGLVAITPASGYVTVLSALIIGLVGGAVCYFGVSILKSKLGYDDALDAFGCHGIGGTWGAIATGLFATKSINPLGADGLFYGDSSLIVKQFIAIGATYAFAAIGTFVILKVISVVCKLRVAEDEEVYGLDITQHGEEAYRDAIMGGSFGKDVVTKKVSAPATDPVNLT